MISFTLKFVIMATMIKKLPIMVATISKLLITAAMIRSEVS